MSFFGKRRECKSRTATKTNGRNTLTLGESFYINASIQPAQPQDLVTSDDLLQRESGVIYKLITTSVLKPMTKSNVSDVVVYKGKIHNVFAGSNWENNILNHNVYLIQEVVL